MASFLSSRSPNTFSLKLLFIARNKSVDSKSRKQREWCKTFNQNFITMMSLDVREKNKSIKTQWCFPSKGSRKGLRTINQWDNPAPADDTENLRIQYGSHTSQLKVAEGGIKDSIK